MAVVATAERGLIVYQLENQPSEFRRIESPLKHQVSRMSDQEACTLYVSRVEYRCTFRRLEVVSKG